MVDIGRAQLPLLLLTVSWACAEEPKLIVAADAGAPDATVTVIADAGVADTGEPPSRDCDPALAINPTEGWVVAEGYFTFVASGGTGDYRFEVTGNESGGVIHERTGRFLSGSTGAVIDTIQVTDDGCDGRATATINVFDTRFELQPTLAEIEPEATLTFRILGGTGNQAFELVRNDSGATVGDDGVYTAGEVEGTDVIRVIDSLSGDVRQATLTIVGDAALHVAVPHVIVPVGQTIDLGVTGGSGHIGFRETVPSLSLDGDVLTASTAGRHRVNIDDLYTGHSVAMSITAVASQTFAPERTGDAMVATTVLAPGDIDGDGYIDAIVAHPDADIGGYNSGAAFVYRGIEGGLGGTPALTITGVNRTDELGRAAALGDFDGDGLVDLALGAPRTDVGTAGDVGIVQIHRGRAGALFSEEPDHTVAGRFGGDLLGWAIAACDFNGDGLDDLAVGAYNAEDRERDEVSSNQGGVFVFFGGPTGFAEEADVMLWGDVSNEDGEWVGVRNLHIGTSLAAADFDGDGICDLAASTDEYDRDTGNTNDGLVLVFRGLREEGLQERPYLGWAGDDPADNNGRFGRKIAAGDLDGDGKAELAVGHYLRDTGPGDNYGAVWVFKGGPFTETASVTLRSPTTADWAYEHPDAWDQVGWYPLIADATGDGHPDLLVGNLYDEVDGEPGDTGSIMVFNGRAAFAGLPESEPSKKIRGASSGDLIGSAFAVIGDVNADGAPDTLAFAHFSDTHGRDVGAPTLIVGDTPDTFVELALPSPPSGQTFGRGAGIVGDIDGDGFDDVVVGAPAAGSQAKGLRTGAAYLYRGNANGFDVNPSMVFDGFGGVSAWDYLGWSVSSAGDFDGDGVGDFAMVSRYDDKIAANSYPIESYALEASCNGGYRNNTGAVFVFLGRRNDLPSGEPSFIIYGPENNDTIHSVAGGFDFDGDRLEDLIFGSLEWDRPGANNAGGFGLVSGRLPDPGGRISVICTPAFVLHGTGSNDNLGRTVTGIGDLDGDGCDEVASGAPLADGGRNNQGEVRVVYGWGQGTCSRDPRMTTMRSGVANIQGGYSVAGGGHDIDADGVPDLAVGMIGLNPFGYGEGGATVISGAFIAVQPTEPAQDVDPPTIVTDFVDEAGLNPVAEGRDPSGRMGASVALVSGRRVRGLLVGSPFGDASGVPRSGGAHFFTWDPTGSDTGGPALNRAAVFGGETARQWSLLGDVVSSGRPGSASVLVGGYFGSATGVDTGSVYGTRLED